MVSTPALFAGRRLSDPYGGAGPFDAVLHRDDGLLAQASTPSGSPARIPTYSPRPSRRDSDREPGARSPTSPTSQVFTPGPCSRYRPYWRTPRPVAPLPHHEDPEQGVEAMAGPPGIASAQASRGLRRIGTDSSSRKASTSSFEPSSASGTIAWSALGVSVVKRSRPCMTGPSRLAALDAAQPFEAAAIVAARPDADRRDVSIMKTSKHVWLAPVRSTVRHGRRDEPVLHRAQYATLASMAFCHWSECAAGVYGNFSRYAKPCGAPTPGKSRNAAEAC